MIEYIIYLFSISGIFCLLCISQVPLTGYLKLLTVMQAGLAAIGAYITAILVTKYGVWFPFTIPFAVMGTVGFAVLVFRVLVNLKAEGQILGSLAVQIILIELILNWDPVTNGALGITGVSYLPFDENYKIALNLLYICFALLISIFMLVRLKKSRIGKAAQLVGENEALAKSLGIDVNKTRVKLIALSAFIAGLAGSVYAYFYGYVDPSGFALMESVLILCVVVIAGGRNLALTLLVGIVIMILPEVLRGLNFSSNIVANIRQIIVGMVLLVAVALPSLRGRRWKVL